MNKKIVIALGGNALGEGVKEQRELVKKTAKIIIDLVKEGNKIVVTHGNGPQVGILNKITDYAYDNGLIKDKFPLDVNVAMSQAYIGYDLQNALYEEVLNNNINKNVVTLITQTIVDKEDKAFKNPTKPIGIFYDKDTADKMIKSGVNMIEDSGRGYREVVASPKPIDILEKEIVKYLMEKGDIVITSGGGGIPVIKKENKFEGIAAVVDKDFASSLLAEQINADMLIILTAVEKVAINYNKENQQWLDNITIAELDKLILEKHFAEGSMLPKVEAARLFVLSGKNRTALITSLVKAKDGISGKTGTRIIS